MRIEVGSRTDVGRARERNEDAMLVREPLFAIADGMGGHRGGDVASSIAVEALQELSTTAEDGAKEITERIREANRRILERGGADRALRGMGTTVTAILADGDKAHLAHVGDSRAYLFREDVLQQLSEDHTLVQRMVREGKLTPAEASIHPQRSVLTRALGMDEPLDVDILTLDLHVADRLLICSDGLSSMVPEDGIRAVLDREPDAQRAADALVDAANGNGGDDNISVIVLDVRTDDGEARASGEGAPSSAVAPDPSPAPPDTAAAAPPTRAYPILEPTRADDVSDGDGEARRPRRWLRALVWLIVVAAIVAVGIEGFRAYVNRQWYVGASGSRVAIYNGIPSTVAGFQLSHVVRTTGLSASRVERLPAYGDLAEGITTNVDSLADAEALVVQMRRDLERAGSSP